MGKTICIGENKGADQLRSKCEADQRLCFCYSDSTIPLLLISSFKLLALFCDCTDWFVPDLDGNPHCLFSHAQAHFIFALPVYDIVHFMPNRSHPTNLNLRFLYLSLVAK